MRAPSPSITGMSIFHLNCIVNHNHRDSLNHQYNLSSRFTNGNRIQNSSFDKCENSR